MFPSFKTENKLFEWMCDKLRGSHIQRIETTTSSGVPDVNFHILKPDMEGWLELKVYEGTIHSLIQLDVRTAQFAWMIQRLRTGGFVTLLLGDTSGNVTVVNPNQIGEVYAKPVSPSRIGETVLCSTPHPGEVLAKAIWKMYLLNRPLASQNNVRFVDQYKQNPTGTQ